MRTKKVKASVFQVFVSVLLFALMGCGGSGEYVDDGTGGGGGGGGTTGSGADSEFGTVTETTRTPGDMDCKGSASSLTSGGYMKFDLSGQSGSVSSAQLKVYVKDLGSNSNWVWVTLLNNDPTSCSTAALFNEIEAHSNICSGIKSIYSGWFTMNLDSKAVNAINQALSSGSNWVAMSLTFE